MRNKINNIVTKAKGQVLSVMTRKDKGIEGIMVVALLCVIAVSLTALFRTEAGNLIDSIFGTMETNITSTLFNEFSPTV
ncbi:MAG: hypothetical protein IKJ39_05555 [Lachnospiraceae bacterium]|nr:hypothetical protein [Lachnospiraceae bacterium]MBR3824647.1 hypothetical protein [Lachnospiraceae bacterium]MBR4084329.1 hypothetical protein [Lachnospiraceae bacterium]MBR6664358.1 hypothetical protein [Lachnospiraceae bacterium]